MTALIGITGLGVEVGSWYATQRSMQGAADAAALSAAFSLAGSGTCTSSHIASCTWSAGLHGLSVASEDGWSHTSTNGVEVGVVSPPTKVGSPFNGQSGYVEVWITRPQPILFAAIFGMAGPTIGAYAIAKMATTVTGGSDCVLALANAGNAVQVDGTGDIRANCGIAIDGGLAQNAGGTPQGGLHFNGGNAKVNISSLVVASSATECPSTQHCFLFNPSTTPLPPGAIKTSTQTADPYASLAFPTLPLGVAQVGVQNGGSGYKAGTRTFTLTGGSFTSPAKFTATVSNAGTVTSIGAVIDPGVYTSKPPPTSPAAVDIGGGSGATFTLTEGCLTWTATTTPIAGRKYCSINLNGAGTTNFPAGSYYIAGGDYIAGVDAGCVGFCISSAQATVTSDSAGVTFYLTHGSDSMSTTYARVKITSGSVTLCAPGTNCGTTCTNPNACMLFFQDPNATPTDSLDPTGKIGPTPAATNNIFQGNGARNLTGLMYLPHQTVSIAGNSAINGCVGVVAKYLDAAGTPSFSNGCLPGNGIGATTTTQISIAE